jgi:hypothetical protein
MWPALMWLKPNNACALVRLGLNPKKVFGLRPRCDLQMRELPFIISDFVERHKMQDRRQLTPRLV